MVFKSLLCFWKTDVCALSVCDFGCRKIVMKKVLASSGLSHFGLTHTSTAWLFRLLPEGWTSVSQIKAGLCR